MRDRDALAGHVAEVPHFAKRGVSQFVRASEPVAPDEHERIVHDAITNTFSLVVAWDRRLKIEVHLFNVVRWRIWNNLRRAHTRAHPPLDVLDIENNAAMVSRDGEPEAGGLRLASRRTAGVGATQPHLGGDGSAERGTAVNCGLKQVSTSTGASAWA
jgi:hypothetical protein